MQETGRAGRNGIKADSYLIIEKNGLLNLKMWLINRTIELSFLKIVYYKLNMYLQVAFGELSEFTHDFNFNKFCNTYKFSKQKTYRHLKFLEQNGVIFFKEKFKNKFLILFRKPLKEASYNSNISKAKIINHILRLHSNIYHEMTEIDIDKISLTCNIKKEYVINTLKTMELEKTVKIKKESSDSQIKFLFPREDDITINKISKNLKHQNEIKKLKFKAVLSYIKNSDVCRSKQLLNYFDEKILDNCGSCDVCQITT
jgi:ATP-dependent DNA helicase RecQ